MGRPVDQPSAEKEKRTGNFASGPRVKLLHLPDSLRFIDLVDYCRFGMASDSRNGCGPVLCCCYAGSSPRLPGSCSRRSGPFFFYQRAPSDLPCPLSLPTLSLDLPVTTDDLYLDLPSVLCSAPIYSHAVSSRVLASWRPSVFLLLFSSLLLLLFFLFSPVIPFSRLILRLFDGLES